MDSSILNIIGNMSPLPLSALLSTIQYLSLNSVGPQRTKDHRQYVPLPPTCPSAPPYSTCPWMLLNSSVLKIIGNMSPHTLPAPLSPIQYLSLNAVGLHRTKDHWQYVPPTLPAPLSPIHYLSLNAVGLQCTKDHWQYVCARIFLRNLRKQHGQVLQEINCRL